MRWHWERKRALTHFGGYLVSSCTTCKNCRPPWQPSLLWHLQEPFLSLLLLGGLVPGFHLFTFKLLIASSIVRHFTILINPVSRQSFSGFILNIMAGFMYSIISVSLHVCKMKSEFLSLKFEALNRNWFFFLCQQ